MKKNKLITVSILGMLLLIPFMIPAKAAPPAYVPVAVEEKYEYELSQFNTNFGQFFTDDMSAVIAGLFFHPAGTDIATIYGGWSWDAVTPQSAWPITVTEIHPETTGALMSVWGLMDNINYTQVDGDYGYTVIHYTASNLYYPWTWYIVNDTYSFALQNVFGGYAFSPYMIQEIPFAPKNIDWNVFAATCQWGLTNYFGGVVGNTTITALSDGYSLSVPVAGYVNNTLPITINVSYNADSILANYTFQYGALTLFYYELASYEVDAVDPVITTSPSDFAVLYDYTGESISWTATDANPGTYTITLDGTTVVTPTAWVNGTLVTYNIPDGLAIGNHTITITFEDIAGNSGSDSVILTVYVIDPDDPVLTSTPSDITHTISPGDIGEYISWTATDAYAATYIIKVNGTIEVYATPWVSGTAVNYYGYYVLGTTTFEITFSDLNGNTVSDSMTITANPVPPSTTTPGIPGFEPSIVIGIVAIGSIGLIVLKKKRK